MLQEKWKVPILKRYSRKKPTINPATPMIAPRKIRNDLVSGRLDSLGAGQSTDSANAMSAVPRATNTFQRSAMPHMLLPISVPVDRLSSAPFDCPRERCQVHVFFSQILNEQRRTNFLPSLVD